VLGRVRAEGLDEALARSRISIHGHLAGRGRADVHQVVVLRLHHIALHRARLARRLVKVKGALCFYVVVAAVAQAVVLADENLCAAAGKLRGRELLLVVLLERGREFLLDIFVAENRLDRLGDVCELCCVRRVGCGCASAVSEPTSPGGALCTKEVKAELAMLGILQEGKVSVRYRDGN